MWVSLNQRTRGWVIDAHALNGYKKGHLHDGGGNSPTAWVDCSAVEARF